MRRIISEREIAAWRKVASEATPRPWVRYEDTQEEARIVFDHTGVTSIVTTRKAADAKFVSMARANFVDVLDALEEAYAELQKAWMASTDFLDAILLWDEGNDTKLRAIVQEAQDVAKRLEDKDA